MSWRRSLSFSDGERDLKDHFDNSGKSDFAKEAMKFFIRFKDKVFIIPEGLSLNHGSRMVSPAQRNNSKKFIK